MERKFNEQEIVKREKLFKMQKEGKDPFVIQCFTRNSNSKIFKEKYQGFTKEELHESQDEIKIAGRVMIIRQTFGIIRDQFGQVQFYLNKKNVPENMFASFKEDLDIGDIIGIVGTPMKTNTGETTISIRDFKILSKCLKPLPEKFHGLSDEEVRARQRYLDLIVNDDSFAIFKTRSQIISTIRSMLADEGYMEVETPVLQPKLGGAAARPFITHHNALDRPYYLRIATELPLKKLIVGGFEKVFELGRIFRNEGMDATHNPEFTTIEGYVAYSSMENIMDEIEKIFSGVAKSLGKELMTYKNVDIDWTKKFKRINMAEFVLQTTGIDFRKITDDQEAIKIAIEKNVSLLPHEKNVGHILNKFFEEFCEEKCLEPTFVFGHPIEVSPLAKKNQDDGRYTDRFELFICGKEYANAFSELNDPIDQLERFSNQLKEKEQGNSEANEMDMDFINALEYGMPPTGGFGIGIDRLVMLFTNCETIRDVLLFPHMRDEN